MGKGQLTPGAPARFHKSTMRPVCTVLAAYLRLLQPQIPPLRLKILEKIKIQERSKKAKLEFAVYQATIYTVFTLYWVL